MSFREAGLTFEVGMGSVFRWDPRFRERGDVRADRPSGPLSRTSGSARRFSAFWKRGRRSPSRR